MRRSTLKATSLVASLLATGLVLTACGGSADAEKEKPKAEPTVEVPTPETWPFTGLDVAEGDDVELERPVLVVKIDNSGKASQSGLSKADLVFEELVEGGTTRLAAFYYSELPEVVGPVRSMRASDIGIIADTGAHVVTSGAAPVTIQRITKAGITFHEEGAAGIFRDTSRPRPYNLMANLEQLAAKAKTEPARPDDYFAFGTTEELPAGEPASKVSVSFGNRTTQWEFGKKAWKNTNTNAAQGDTYTPDTILALTVGVEDAGYKDPSGAFVPESVFDGSGTAQLFHAGKVVTGTWSKRGLDGELRLEADGKELKVPAGRVFVELVPENGTVTVTP